MSTPPQAPTIEALCADLATTKRAVRTALYGCLLSVLAALLIGIGTIAYAGHLDERQRRDARADSEARQQQGLQTTQLICALSLAQAEAFRDATSPAGTKSRDAWIALAHRFNCIP